MTDTTPAQPEKTLSPVTKMLLELGPLMVFFFTNARGGWLIENVPAFAIFPKPIFLATALFMAAFVVSLVATWILARKLPIMPLVSGVVVLVFGGLTLYLQDDLFIKIKPTIVNVMFGATLLIGLAFGKPLLEYVFNDAYSLEHEGWVKLSFRWGCFFFFLALLNELAWRLLSTDGWVAFKVWGVMPITFIFALFQLKVLKDHGLDEESKKPLG